MVEIGKFSDFNQSNVRSIENCPDKELGAHIAEQSAEYPLIYKLLTETTRFYTEEFNELLVHIKREKRLIVFETPSRIALTHEYTVEDVASVKQNYHYLFNTKERLNWLKIELDGRRVSIASKDVVMKRLKQKISHEAEHLASFLSISSDKVVERLYYASDGLPCFVEFNQTESKGQQSLLLCITFFDSIRDKKPKKKVCSFSPLQEKELVYNYSTISKTANAWLYIKAPSNFVIKATHNAASGYYEQSPSSDEEIWSFVLTPKGDNLSVDFTISVTVPDALKVWYNVLLYMAAVLSVIGLFALGYSLIGQIHQKMIETYFNCVYAVIAGLIATRGWLMSEEQVMKKLSIRYTWLIVIMIAIVLGLSTRSFDDKSLEKDGCNVVSGINDVNTVNDVEEFLYDNSQKNTTDSSMLRNDLNSVVSSVDSSVPAPRMKEDSLIINTDNSIKN